MSIGIVFMGIGVGTLVGVLVYIIISDRKRTKELEKLKSWRG